jgi:NADPH:quinone reductase-like Zn-dependent oxidoreductase
MATMRAWVQERTGPPETAFALRERPVPEPGPGQLRVAVEAFGLNFADVMARKGLYPDRPPLPAVLGYDVVGTVEAIGPEPPDGTPPVGTRVAALTRFGGYAEKALTDARAVLPLPEGYDAVKGCALATQFGTAWHAARGMLRLHAGEQVLVHAAAGGVGTALVQIALRDGCTVFGTAGSAAKREALADAGVHHPIDYRRDDWADEVARLAGPQGLDAVFDAIGGKTFRRGVRLLGPGGRMVSYGAAALSDAPNPFVRALRGLAFGFWHPVQFLSPSKSLIGINMLRLADHRPERLAEALRGVGTGVAEGWLDPVAGGRYPAEGLAEAHRALESRASVGKLAVAWS